MGVFDHSAGKKFSFARGLFAARVMGRRACKNYTMCLAASARNGNKMKHHQSRANSGGRTDMTELRIVPSKVLNLMAFVPKPLILPLCEMIFGFRNS